MGKKKATRRDDRVPEASQLRKRLRKAEKQLLDASSERDQAQARVEAFSIIADEVRAQLAEAEQAAMSARSEAAADREAADETESAPSRPVGRARPGPKPAMADLVPRA